MRLLREGVPFMRAPAMAMECSNLGYALLGRIVANVSQQPYKDFVQRTLLGPLGMTATGYDVAAAPAERSGPLRACAAASDQGPFDL